MLLGHTERLENYVLVAAAHRTQGAALRFSWEVEVVGEGSNYQISDVSLSFSLTSVTHCILPVWRRGTVGLDTVESAFRSRIAEPGVASAPE